MTDFDRERFMIKARLLAARKILVHDNRVAKCDVRQTPYVFSDSPGILECLAVYFTTRGVIWLCLQ